MKTNAQLLGTVSLFYRRSQGQLSHLGAVFTKTAANQRGGLSTLIRRDLPAKAGADAAVSATIFAGGSVWAWPHEARMKPLFRRNKTAQHTRYGGPAKSPEIDNRPRVHAHTKCSGMCTLVQKCRSLPAFCSTSMTKLLVNS